MVSVLCCCVLSPFFDQKMSFWRFDLKKTGEMLEKGRKKHHRSFFRLCVTSSEEEGVHDQAASDDLDRMRAEV